MSFAIRATMARAQLFSLRSAAGSVRAAHARCVTLAVSRPRLLALRSSRSSLSSSSSSSTSTSTSSANVAQQAAAEEDALMLTPVQKVAAGFRLSMYGGLFVLASTCGYFVVMYLFPTRMSPQGAFNSALEFVRRDERVIARFGEPLKGYGRDPACRGEGAHRSDRGIPPLCLLELDLLDRAEATGLQGSKLF